VTILNVQWNIGNTCNQNCWYCPSVLKEGSVPFPSIEQFSKVLDRISDHSDKFESVQIELTGGEPSVCEAVLFHLSRPVDKIKYKFYSNGSADLSVWQSISSSINELSLSLHNSSQLEHFLQIIDLFKDRVFVFVAMDPNQWDQQVSAYEVLKTKATTRPQMLYKNFTKGNHAYYDYSEDQWSWYFSEIGVNPKNSQDVATTQEYKKVNLENNFHGHLCWAGVSQFVIDNRGYAYRGWCGVNTMLGHIYSGDLNLFPQPKVCPRNQCTNGFDLLAPKSEKGWGFS